jgi:hypothetical protein
MIFIPCLTAKILVKELFRLSLLRGKLYKSLKKHVCGAARLATSEIGYDETGRWGRIGNVRYEEAASLLKRDNNGPDETGLLTSGLLGVLKEVLKSDEIQITLDKPGVRKICGEIATKAQRRRLFCHYEGTP